MLSRLFVVFLVKPAHQFLEDGAHGVIVEGRKQLFAINVLSRPGTEINAGIHEFFDEIPKNVRFH